MLIRSSILIFTFQFSCSFSSNGCAYQSQYENLNAHEERCQFNDSIETKCEDCDQCLTMLDKKEHNCFKLLHNKLKGVIDNVADIQSKMTRRDVLFKNISKSIAALYEKFVSTDSKIDQINQMLIDLLKRRSDGKLN